MNKRLLFLMLFFAIFCVGCNTNRSSSEEEETDYIVETKRFADRVLHDPAIFDMDFKTEQDSLGITITESPDGNVRFYPLQ